MIFPLPIAGIALAGKMLLSRNNNNTPVKSIMQLKLQPRAKPMEMKLPNIQNPVETLVRGLTSAVSEIKKRVAGEDYNSVVRSFLPDNAKLISPKYPADAHEFHLADLDGDSQEELISTYRHDNHIKTMILKKQKDSWLKVAEISNSDYESLNYRNTVNITGETKKQLLMGLTANGKEPVLYGYSLDNNKVIELFAHNYHRFEVLEPQQSGKQSKTRLAIWSRNDSDTYNIDVMHWNGSSLEPQKSSAAYYYRNVVPQYAQNVKRMPYDPVNWYKFADYLEKSGETKDAMLAVEVGMDLAKDASMKEKFEALKNRIKTK